jgi:DNA polymerase I-like protein with 3'-5' exonuclease and polymerase domains
MLDLRLAFMELEGIARYLRKLVGRERVHPHMLPTQASGRWSTTNPPLVNFPAHAEDDCDRCARVKLGELPVPEGGWCPRAVREVILPDAGWYSIHFDLNAIEGRFGAADAHDEEELDAYRKNEDVHTALGAVPMFGLPAPPIRTKALHTSTSPECIAWRDGLIPPWGGSEDRRRHLAKTLKYATLYGKDHKGAGTAKGVEKLRNSDGSKMTKAQVEAFAKVYLRSKPILTRHKMRRFEEYARANVSYTFRGRRRRLFGDAWTRAKEGWSHRLQGAVPDIMNDYIIQIAALFPEGYIVLNSHDGLTWSMPFVSRERINEVVQAMRKVVERDWEYEGVSLPVAADWEILYPDGTKEKVK